MRADVAVQAVGLGGAGTRSTPVTVTAAGALPIGPVVTGGAAHERAAPRG